MQEKEITVTVTNQGKNPVLIRSWIDTGDVNEVPEKIRAPFIVGPPLARIDEGHTQSLRLTYIGGSGLPRDRESLFWLNVHEIPPRPSAGEGSGKSELGRSAIQLAFRYRVKVFLRPEGLTGSAVDAIRSLHWSKQSDNGVMAKNDTPYFVSLGAIEVSNGVTKITAIPDVIAPFSSRSFKLDAPIVGDGTRWSINYSAIDEWGGIDRESKTLIEGVARKHP